jgi:hypothetical protein
LYNLDDYIRVFEAGDFEEMLLILEQAETDQTLEDQIFAFHKELSEQEKFEIDPQRLANFQASILNIIDFFDLHKDIQHFLEQQR